MVYSCEILKFQKKLDLGRGAGYDGRVMTLRMRNFPVFFILVLAALVFGPLGAMPIAAQGKAAAEAPAAPRSGVRFVIVSPSGESIPSPLYCKQGKSFVALRIGARTASQRVKPEAGGIVRFWKEDPAAAATAAAGAGTAKPGRKPVAIAEAALPEPYMTVKLPSEADSKTLCILVPNGQGKAQTFCVNEGEVPASGVHLINFSPYPLQMLISKTGDFSDKQTQNVGFFQRSEGITPRNSWSYKGENGESASFMLMCKTAKDKPFQRVRASRFVISSRQSQITVVVKDATREGVKMLSIQLTDR